MGEEIKQSDVLSELESRTLFGWGENIFGVVPHSLAWRPKDVHFVLYEDAQPRSHVGLLKHVVRVDSQPVAVAGVGAVVTVPEAQRHGMAERLMQHAVAFIGREWTVDAGLLFCLEKMEAYYARLGWQTIDGPVIFDQPSGPTTSPLRVMVLPLERSSWPPGVVQLDSLPW